MYSYLLITALVGIEVGILLYLRSEKCQCNSCDWSQRSTTKSFEDLKIWMNTKDDKDNHRYYNLPEDYLISPGW